MLCPEPHQVSNVYVMGSSSPRRLAFLEGWFWEAVMLKDAFILIVEDELLIALDLAMAVEEAGGIVVGPASTTIEALALIANAQTENKPISAAVLDGNLADRDVSPVVSRLHAEGVPMVVYSAVGLPKDVSSFSADIPWIPKPAAARRVIAVLTEKLASRTGFAIGDTGSLPLPSAAPL